MNPALKPVRAPPPGVESNFINPPSLMSAVITGTVVIQLITILFISARAYVNITTRTVRPEDILSYLAYSALTLQMILICIASSHGMARHIWDVNLGILIPSSRLYNIIFICYTVSGGFAKACVFLQFKRIFTTALKGTVYWVIVSSLTINAIAYTMFFFFYVFTCTPREKIWNPSIPGTCLDSNKLNMGIGALNTISDIEAFLVPAWAIWQLNMDVRRKLEVFAVFAVGALAVAIGCVGMYYRVLILRRPDFTWLLTQTAIICMAELSVVIIVGCCPYLPHIVRQTRILYTGNSLKPGESSSTLHPPSKSKFNPFHRPAPSNVASWQLSSGSNEHPVDMHQYDGRSPYHVGPEDRPEDLLDLQFAGN